MQELKPGHTLIIKYNGQVEEVSFAEPKERRACSFERIYFSRGNDREIYRERKKLGELLAKPALEAVNFDLKHTVFGFIPNTAEAASYGLTEGLDKELNKWKQEQLLQLENCAPKGHETRIAGYFSDIGRAAPGLPAPFRRLVFFREIPNTRRSSRGQSRLYKFY
jgi:hypothetical protein